MGASLEDLGVVVLCVGVVGEGGRSAETAEVAHCFEE